MKITQKKERYLLNITKTAVSSRNVITTHYQNAERAILLFVLRLLLLLLL